MRLDESLFIRMISVSIYLDQRNFAVGAVGNIAYRAYAKTHFLGSEGICNPRLTEKT